MKVIITSSSFMIFPANWFMVFSTYGMALYSLPIVSEAGKMFILYNLVLQHGTPRVWRPVSIFDDQV